MALLRPTGRDGEYEIEGLGKIIRINEWRIGDVYDTIQTDTAPSAGVTYALFRDVTNKARHQTNLRQSSKLPAKQELIITRIGCHVWQVAGEVVMNVTTLLKVYTHILLTFKIGERLVAEGPGLMFQAGIGVAGFDSGGVMLTNGVPSAAAAPELLVPQPVNSDDELNGDYSFRANSATSTSPFATSVAMPGSTTALLAALVYCILHGFQTKPVGG